MEQQENQPQPDYNYLDKLNPQQRDAVTYNDGPQLVIAGAGSGKTRVLTYKIVDLLRHGYEPWRVMALTFTNKAAEEMKQRIRDMVGPGIADRIRMGTFHSVFLRILRTHSDRLGYPHNFTIYDATDSKSLVKMIIKDLNLDDKAYKPATVASLISNAKNSLVTPDIYNTNPEYSQADAKAKRPMLGRLYELYCDRCRIAGAMDFDDILVNMNILLRDNPDLLEQYQDYFRYILVDEYQDTNFAQHLIISQLAEKRRRLCVVGDDAQSIYSFRGANITNILEMQKRWPDLQIFKLERNYRSTQNIIDAAGSLIEKNTRQLEKKVYSENEKGEPIEIIRNYSDMEEAFTVVNVLQQRRATFRDSYDNFAILYRTNAQSRLIEEALRKKSIPYRVYGGLSFYQRKEIKDAICYFRLAVNPDDDEALRRVINYPARGIGETTMKKLTAAATRNGVSIWRVLSDPQANGVAANGGTLKKLAAFREMISSFIADNAGGVDAYELGQLIYNRTGLLTALAHDRTPESISRQENLAELLAGLKEFTDLHREAGDTELGMSEFLSEVSLATDQDEEESGDESKVTLMTIHAAKGLEFNHVFIVGLEEELFPSAMSMDSMMQVEEERRLMYVAMTRARTTCTVTYASSRFRNGQTNFTRPSRFLHDIDRRYVRLTSASDLSTSPVGPDPMRRFVDNYMSNAGGRPDSLRTNSRRRAETPAGGKKVSFDSTDAHEVESVMEGRLRAGVRIRHNRFGTGTVRLVEIASGSEVVTVDFDQLGLKKLLLKYAKIEIL